MSDTYLHRDSDRWLASPLLIVALQRWGIGCNPIEEFVVVLENIGKVTLPTDSNLEHTVIVTTDSNLQHTVMVRTHSTWEDSIN